MAHQGTDGKLRSDFLGKYYRKYRNSYLHVNTHMF